MSRPVCALRTLAALPLLLALSACAGDARRSIPNTTPDTTFVLVRHAEKATDHPKDPSLSEAGIARAARLSASLADAPLRAVYASAYRRTRATAEPAAVRHGLTITPYDAGRPAADFAAELRQRHVGGTVLVVGHSNTVPALAAALCVCEVHAMREDEYDRRIEIRIARDGDTRIDTGRY